MSYKRQFVILVLGLTMASVIWADTASKPTLESIGSQVYCACGGCVGLLNNCPHSEAECPVRAKMEKFILLEISQGKDEKAILHDLVGIYGVKILAAPPAKGFDLTVWILPGIGFAMGLIVAIFFVRRWRSQVPAGAGALAPPDADLDPKVLQAVEDEMKKVSG
jgi:cytochrome c-type biogenesis protein CcmH/NrfF